MATTTDKTGRRAWILLDLDVQGRVYRFTNAPSTQVVTDAKGATFAYSPGLDDMTLERRSDSTTTSLSLTINAQQEVSWAKMLERGHVLERSRALVRRFFEGQILDVANVWIRGRVVSPAWGNDTEPLSFTVERLRREAGVIPTDGMQISATTWPVAASTVTDAAILGAWYPMVYGTPSGAMTPAYMVEFKASALNDSKLMIAGHAVGATTVTLHDVKGAQSGTTAVIETTDLLGRTISYVDFNTVSFAPEEDREYRIAWDQGAAGVGQGYKEGGTTYDGAGEIMRHWAKTWSDLDIDDGRFAANLASLNQYRLATVITEQRATWDVIDEALALLPVEWTESAAGEYPALWNIGSTADDATGALIDCTRVTGRYTRSSAVQSTGGPIANRFTLQYGVGGAQTTQQSTVTVGSGNNLLGELDTTDGAIPNARCAISERIFGRRPAPTVKTEIISDAATAALICHQWALLYSLPRRSMSVEGDLSLDEHPLNAVVLVTATDVNITAELATVRGKSYAGDVVTLDLLLLDSPLTKTRATT